MGVLSDLIVAPRSAASEVLVASLEDPRWPRVDVKGLGITMMDAAGRLLKADVWSYDTLAKGGKEGPWLFEVPPAMVDAFHALDETSMEAFITAWHVDEETQTTGWDRDAVGYYTSALMQGAAIAKERNEQLLLWLSL